jgi:hypothetical protein
MCISDFSFNCFYRLFSFNADQLPDLLAETKAGVRAVWLSTTDNVFDKKNFTSYETQPFRLPGSHAFVDVNQDNTAGNAFDLSSLRVIYTKYISDFVIGGQDSYEEWLNIVSCTFNVLVKYL